MNEVNSFTIYKEYYDLITLLSDKEQANLCLAIFKYMFEDKEIKLNDRENKVFINLKRPLNKSKNKSKSATKTKSNQNQIEIKSKSNVVAHQDVNVNDNVYVNGNVNNIYTFIEDNFSRTLSPIEYEQISEWEDTELTRYAIKQAVLNGAYSIKYISRILESYKTKNITTVQQAQEEDKQFKQKRNGTEQKELADRLTQDIQVQQASDEDIRKLEERMKRVKNEN